MILRNFNYFIKEHSKSVVIDIMIELGTFPFGNPVRKVEQKNRTSKRVFVFDNLWIEKKAEDVLKNFIL